MVAVDVSLPSGVAVLDGVAPTWGNKDKVYLVVGTPVELQQVESSRVSPGCQLWWLLKEAVGNQEVVLIAKSHK